MKPKVLPKEELLKFLKQMVVAVEADDSFEGSLEYSCTQEGLQPGQFAVTAAVRVGNSEGQGGMLLIGEDAEIPETETRIKVMHQECPVEFYWVPKGEEAEYAFLDLGYPGDNPDELSGPRIAVRRFQGSENGWRILIHPDGGDPIKSINIFDGSSDESPVVTMHNEE